MENRANLCRFCLKWTADYDLIPLFGQPYTSNANGEWKRLANFIYHVEGLPVKMCTTCQTQINWTLAFQQQIYENELTLRLQLAMGSESKFLETSKNDTDCVDRLGAAEFLDTKITEEDTEFNYAETSSAIEDTSDFMNENEFDQAHVSQGLSMKYKSQDNPPERMRDFEALDMEAESRNTGNYKQNTVTEFEDNRDEILFRMERDDKQAVETVQNSKKPTNEVDNRKRNLSGSSNASTKFECHCGKRFSWKITLNQHKKTHDEKFDDSLRCPDCGKKFCDRTRLSHHVKSVHQGYFYECPICGNRQSDNSNSLKHIKKHHPGSVAKPIEKCDKQ
jgi:transcription elongation factor Elf1